MATENIVVNITANADALKPTIELLQKMKLVSSEDADEFIRLTGEIQKFSRQAIEATKSTGQLTKGIEDESAELQKLAALIIASASSYKASSASKQAELDKEIAKLKQLAQFQTKAANPESQKQLNALIREQVQKIGELSGIVGGKVVPATESLRTQLRLAKEEAIQLAQQFGEFSPQAIEAAKRAAELDDRFKDFNKTVQALNPEAKLTAFVQLGSGIAGAFTAAQGAMALFGEESEDVQRAILKVQAALALTQGLNSVLQLKDAFRDLRIVLGITSVAGQGAAASIKAISAALLTNPITLVVAALGTLVAAFINSEEKSKALREELAKQAQQAKEHSEAVEKLEIEYLAASGAIDSVQQSLESLRLEENKVVTEEQAAAYERATESTKSWVDALGPLSILFRSQAELQEEFTQALDKENAIAQKVIDRIKELNKLREDAIKIQERRRLEQSIFNELLKQNELLTNNEIQLARVRLQNLAREEALEVSQATGNALKIQEIRVRFANRRIQLEKDLTVAIRNEEAARVRAITQAAEELDQIGVDFGGITEQQRLLIKLTNEWAEALNKGPAALRDFQNNLEKIVQEAAKLPDKIALPEGREIKIGLSVDDIEATQKFNKIQKAFQSIFGKDSLLTDEGIQALKGFAAQAEEIFFGIFDNIAAGFRANADELTRLKDLQLEAFEQEAQALELANDRKLLSDGALAQKQAELAKKREATEKELNKKIAEEKRKAFIAQRAAALIEVAIDTAQNAVKLFAQTIPPGILSAIAVAFGAAQAALIAGQPIPKFKKGVIALQGPGTEHSDSIPAMLSRGESVMTAKETTLYRPTLEAIRQNRISPEVLNRVAVSHQFGPVEAYMDTGKLIRSTRKTIPQQADEIGRAVAKYMKSETYYSPLRK